MSIRQRDTGSGHTATYVKGILPVERTGCAVALSLLFRFGLSVTSDAVEKVPTGGELTLIEAVGRARA
jgi:hypothetical protein